MHRRERSPSCLWSAAPLLGGIRRLAFWLAIVAPVGYAVILAIGLDDRTEPLLGALVALNLVCLLVGHEHAQ